MLHPVLIRFIIFLFQNQSLSGQSSSQEPYGAVRRTLPLIVSLNQLFSSVTVYAQKYTVTILSLP